MKGSMNLQDSFLNQVRKDGAEVKVALLDGTMLRGIVKGFDNFTIVLSAGGGQHLIYKHAIAQIVTRRLGPRRDGRPAAEPAAAKAEEPFNAIDLGAVREQTPEGESEPQPAPSPSTAD